MARRRTGPTMIQRSRGMSAEEKALYHHVAGAGKSRVKRQFFDVSESDIDDVIARVDAHLERIATMER